MSSEIVIAPPPSDIRNAFIIWWATTVHILMGVLLLYDGDLKDVSPAVANTVTENPVASGLILIGASILATVGFLLRPTNRFMSWLFFLPQQFILLLTLISSVAIILTEEFNGRHVDWDVALIILAPGMAAAVWHTVAVIHIHATGFWAAWRRWRLG